jgi:uncharacterized protein YqjF (DUF2071 family)
MRFARMRWYDPFCVHWRVPSADVRRRIQPGLQLDLHEGQAYVSLVALHAVGPLPGPALSIGLGALLTYTQLNLRTYVVGDEGPGILVFDTRVDHLLPALGARLCFMPYWFQRPIDLCHQADECSLTTSEIAVSGRLRPDSHAYTPQAGTLASFLLDRVRVYTPLPGGLGYVMRVAHAPWIVRDVEVVSHQLGSAAGIPIAEPPAAAHLCNRQDVAFVHVGAQLAQLSATTQWPAAVEEVA